MRAAEPYEHGMLQVVPSPECELDNADPRRFAFKRAVNLRGAESRGRPASAWPVSRALTRVSELDDDPARRQRRKRPVRGRAVRTVAVAHRRGPRLRLDTAATGHANYVCARAEARCQPGAGRKCGGVTVRGRAAGPAPAPPERLSTGRRIAPNGARRRTRMLLLRETLLLRSRRSSRNCEHRVVPSGVWSVVLCSCS